MKIIIWGYSKKDIIRDTLSYVWEGFYKAWSYLGHEVYWFDDQDRPHENFNWDNALFLCESYKCDNIPIIKSCTYLIHTLRESDKAKFADAGRIIDLRYNTLYQDHKVNYNYYLDKYEAEKLGECVYYESSPERLYISWATNLLPHEINILDYIPHRLSYIPFVGTLYDDGYISNINEINLVKEFCKEHSLDFVHIDPWSRPLSNEDNIALIRRAIIAPDIRGKRDIDIEYIPCRIFKNISYGQLGITNSHAIHQCLKETTIYHPNIKKALEIAMSKINDIKRIQYQMNIVRNDHTFISRIKAIEKIL